MIRLLFLLILLFQLAGPSRAAVPVVYGKFATSMERLAARDLSDALTRLFPRESFPLKTRLPTTGNAVVVGSLQSLGWETEKWPLREWMEDIIFPKEPESFLVKRHADGKRTLGLILAPDARGTVHGVYALLRKLGCGFHLTGDTLPEPAGKVFSFDGWDFEDRPIMRTRLVFNWHNFLSGCSTWNLEDWNRWTDQSLKMGFNAIMVHAYGNNPMVSFEFNGKTKPVGYLSTTRRGRDWSTMHVNDVRRLHGGHVFRGPEFGADAAQVPGPQRATAARNLMRDVFNHAENRGADVYFAVDVDTMSANPQDLILTLPESARFPVEVKKRGWMGQEAGRRFLANPDTPEGYRYYRTQVETLLRDYAAIDCLVVWFRTHTTPWMEMDVKEMPPAWREEFRAALQETPEAEKMWKSHNIFALSKIVMAFRRALEDIGRPEVSLAIGTWDFDFLPAADRFLPPDVRCIGLDYDVLHGKPAIEDPAEREVFARVGSRRPLIPVVWAHHDDGAYVGRPYTPSAHFCDKLEASRAEGFGIIHWTTRPLDLFFASLSRQVWAGTKNQELEETCRDAASRWVHPSARETMGAYLHRWITTAPQFGRETMNEFIHKPLEDAGEVVRGCRERLKLLEAVDRNDLPLAGRALLDYHRGLEEFTIEFFENHERFQESRKKLKAGDLAGARQCMQHCDPGPVIGKFADFTSTGGITRGEAGIVVTLNTRWLAPIVKHRWALGLEPVRINFAPTSHDPLAQMPGPHTFHSEQDRKLWDVRGEKETGARVTMLDPTEKLTLAYGIPESWRVVLQTGVTSPDPIRFSFPETPAGKYRVRLLYLDLKDVKLHDAGVAMSFRHKPAGKPVVEIPGVERLCLTAPFKEPGTPTSATEFSVKLDLKDRGSLEVTISPDLGPAVIQGAVLEPAD